ncbi:flagellar basal-body MS-ring/collar protein FliF [Tranquillimonas alkanivorans]|uniref:Flagellar M-ring protein n=1 Tax=Tranquillimonas alkanivorans TaxID=441119 RepID=A0A1I5S3U6_9RHOB|nr:flagellar basal-body MS-ring/collar protein FliF [Tranquillimonas alkanivorans]SFP65395.1 flagellar M-ring protein FliF [Tranquillimonas alkanivorans]
MKAILDNLKSLGRTRLIALGATGVGLVAALLFGLNAVMAPSYAPLYSELSPAGAADIVSTLEQAGFAVDVSPDGTTVSVPRTDLARARMSLAERGLPDQGVPGWELFDNASGLGMNTFMQRVNRLRALEGELARSIQTIDGVDAARVHLVLPEREAFSRDRPEPSASVIVRGRARHAISRRQGQAIRALVASAVPEMSPGRVTVLSATGETILAEDGDGTSDITLQSVRASIEERMARNVSQILTARVGAGNARVQVSVDLTSEREVVVSRSFDPSQQVARSIETREEEVEDRENASGEVGVGNNLPEELQDGGANGPQSTNSRTRTDEIVNYEIGSTESETTREPGDIERVSVAVLVNGIYDTLPNGDVEYRERPAEELERLGELVKTAIGFNEARGDTVSIDSLRFMDYSMELGEPVGRSMAAVISDSLPSILRGLFALAVMALILFFGMRPLRALIEPKKIEDETPALTSDAQGYPALTAEGQQAAAQQAQIAATPGALQPQAGQTAIAPAGGGTALAAPVAGAEARSGDVLDPVQDGEVVRLAAVHGGVDRKRLNSVGELAESHPDETLNVVRGWLQEA